MKQDNMLAMILAGGRGSRLHELTSKVAKPAVSYGGKYRIIDFPLSNCANSGIDVVGVLTQYESVLLNSYVSAGRRWGLDAKDSGVYVLPPREKADAELNVYRGTADAISQNIDFIDSFAPDYLLILSGDHIYKMNYAKMLAYHKEHKADATIAVIPVPMKEASRFGIMNTNEDGSIYEFEEKPKQPKSTNASMGIYVFKWSVLKKYLEMDEADRKSENDFGKNVIPAILNDGYRLMAYRFEGYWKDVGTIDSLWQANMDLLGDKPAFDISDVSGGRIRARNTAMPSSYIAPNAEVKDSFVAEGCEVFGSIRHSVLSTGCAVGKGAEITDSVIMPNVVVENGASIRSAIIAEGCHIKAGARIGGGGTGQARKITVIGKEQTVGEGAVIEAGTIR